MFQTVEYKGRYDFGLSLYKGHCLVEINTLIMIRHERNDNYARTKMLSQRKKGGSFIKKHTDTYIKFKVYLKNILEMTMRRAAGLEQAINRGLGILRPGQASSGEGQTGVDKGKAMFLERQGCGERERHLLGGYYRRQREWQAKRNGY